MPSPFVWYELMTTDTVAAQAFYSAVVGWSAKEMEMPCEVPGPKYTIFSAGENGVAGLMTMPEGYCKEGGRPCWLGYIYANDVDATVEQIKQKGGALHYGPEDIPTVGRFAAVSDPHGAVFMLINPIGEAPAERPGPETPGYCGWRELHAGNGEEAWAFYSELFGWEKSMAVDMGDLGVYQTFMTGHDMGGGMMTKMPDTPKPLWNYYFNVDDINAAVERVKANGGQLIMGPHEVPGGSWIAQGFDPQGAIFALVAPGPSPA